MGEQCLQVTYSARALQCHVDQHATVDHTRDGATSGEIAGDTTCLQSMETARVVISCQANTETVIVHRGCGGIFKCIAK